MTNTAETMADSLDALCRISHDAYEAAAAGAGWETNPASRVAWDDVPAANKAAMRASVAAVEAQIREQIAQNIEAAKAGCGALPGRDDIPTIHGLTIAAAIARGGDHG